MDGSSHDSSIKSLRSCVLHATTHGHIDNAGVSQALLAKVDAAATALPKGNMKQAANILKAFISQVDALSGRNIDAVHAGHLRSHAASVIAALGG